MRSNLPFVGGLAVHDILIAAGYYVADGYDGFEVWVNNDRRVEIDILHTDSDGVILEIALKQKAEGPSRTLGQVLIRPENHAPLASLLTPPTFAVGYDRLAQVITDPCVEAPRALLLTPPLSGMTPSLLGSACVPAADRGGVSLSFVRGWMGAMQANASAIADPSQRLAYLETQLARLRERLEE